MNLKTVYEQGVRLITLTWNHINEVGFPNFKIEVDTYGDIKEKPNFKIPNTEFGLTDFGVELIREMERLGIIVDVSHLSDAGFYDVLKYSKKPFVASHSNSRKITNVVRNLTDELMMEIALLENLQRENLNCIEEALAYKSMITTLGLTQESLATKVGKSRSHITNMLGLLRLPQSVQDMVSSGNLSMGHARVLSKIEDNYKIVELANKIVNEKLAVRDIEQISESDDIEKKVKITRQKNPSNENYKYVENLLREKYDSKVKIKDKKIEIGFTSSADLNRILEIMDIKG